MKVPRPATKMYESHIGDWAALPEEPCRFCRAIGGIMFCIDEGPEGRDGQQIMRCEKCKRTWNADSSNA